MVSKYTNEIILQGYYGNKWEDIIYCEDEKDAKSQLKVYNENETCPHRIIHRREITPEYKKTLTGVDVIEYRWGTKGALPLALSFYVPKEQQWYNMEGDSKSSFNGTIDYYTLSSLTPTNKKSYIDGWSDNEISKINRKKYLCEGDTLKDAIECLKKHYNIFPNTFKGMKTNTPIKKTQRKTTVKSLENAVRRMW